MANSVEPDETPHSMASHLGLHCLLRPVCPNTYGKCGNCSIKKELCLPDYLEGTASLVKLLFSSPEPKAQGELL